MVVKNNQMTITGPKEDLFVKLIGNFGRWQFLLLSSISLVKLSSGWVQMAILFLTPKLTFRCVSVENSTELLLNNTCYSGCSEYKYDTTPFDNTIVSEWGLVCDRRWLASFTQTVLQLGVLIGSILFGFLSDRYGRKITFLIATMSVVVIGLGVPFSPNYVVFTTLRFFLGLATAGTMVVSFVIVMEAIGSKYREAAGCLFHIPFIIGHMTVPLFAYYFRSWDTYMLALSIPPLIYIGYFFTLSESPRWLVSQRRVSEATVIVKKAAALNKLPTGKVEETLQMLSDEISRNSSESRLNYTALFQKSLMTKTLCCWTMWLILGIVYFGLNQYISQTSPNPFISIAVAATIQLPSNLVSIWLIKTLGRRLTTSIFFIIGGAFIIMLYFVPDIFVLNLILGTLGVSCASIVACAIYVYTTELYPTVVRNMGIGASSTAMRVGTMLAPFISNSVVSVPWLPNAIFGVAALIAGLVCLVLPETKGVTLADSIDKDEDEKISK